MAEPAVRVEYAFGGDVPIISTQGLIVFLGASDQRGDGGITHQGDRLFSVLFHVRTSNLK